MSSPDDNDPTRKRRAHRRVVAREVTAEVRSRGSRLSYSVLNISTGGLLLAGDRPPARGALLEIELNLAGTRPVHVTGKVVRELVQDIGIAFEPLSSAVAASLDELIAAVDARNNLPPPLPPRSHKDEPPPAAADPFSSGPDPRPPRSSSPEDRTEYLRTLLKKREETIQRGRTAFQAVTAEAGELRASAARLKSRLEAAQGQLALGEASLAASRKSAEKHASELEDERVAARAKLEEERATASQMLEREQRQTLEAIGAVAGLEGKLRRLETEAASARQEAEAARREVKSVASEASALRKTREELVAANRKAMDVQVALTRERASLQAAEELVREARAAQQAAQAEVKRLGDEVARQKAKLIAAENALERSATRKAPDRSRSNTLK